jgi:uncharacterized protein (DUF1800 family)
MDRRDFFTAPFKEKNQQKEMPERTEKVSLRDVTSTLAPYEGAWGKKEVIHLLKRTMFGAKVDDVNYFLTKTLTQAVEELLTPSAAAATPTPPIKEYDDPTAMGNTPDGLTKGTTWVDTISFDGTVNGRRRFSYKKWLVGLMINQDRSILEKMTLFWLNHFGTETDTIGIGIYCYRHNKLLRDNALGDFKELVRKVTLDQAMLRYLNGYLNTATAPDENYARELQELFTLGKGIDSKFTEDDVKEAAKVLTGYSINSSGNTVFTPSRHSSVNKTFSAFYNNTIITGRTGSTAGDLELTALLNMIFANDEVAKFIVRKLYIWFVYYEIDAATENNIITPLANLFRTNGYQIKPVLDKLFKSQHFFDVQNRGCQIKSPVDLVIGGIREFNMVIPPLTDTSWDDAYGMWNYISGRLDTMQQSLHDPPSVSGWPAYYQEPKFYEIWINTDTLPKRNIYTDTLVNSGYTRNGKKIVYDCVALAKLLSNPSDPNRLIDDLVGLFLGVPISEASKTQLKLQILLSGQTSDYYWTNAWNAYIAEPTNTGNFNIVNTRLKELCKYLMNLAEYQLC